MRACHFRTGNGTGLLEPTILSESDRDTNVSILKLGVVTLVTTEKQNFIAIPGSESIVYAQKTHALARSLRRPPMSQSAPEKTMPFVICVRAMDIT